jgi:hypothetical protein
MKSPVQWLVVITFILAFGSPARAGWICDHSAEFCGDSKNSRENSSSPAYPSNNSSININPSAVPIETGFGLETLYYNGQLDFGLVRGLGRVGAALSPSNNDETFFGPPGFEQPFEYYDRKEARQKYPQQKVSLAAAVNLYKNKKSNLSRFEVNLGGVVKYNRFTYGIRPGVGINTVAGPFTFGYSIAQDEVQLNYDKFGNPRTSTKQYVVASYSLGVSLSSLALDYSVLSLQSDQPATVAVSTASLFVYRAILTLSSRLEQSERPYYNFASHQLETRYNKNDLFFGLQYSFTNSFMVGAFYNYYLLREVSAGLTLFF